MKGILFSAPMVRAILEGRKSVTRRIVPERILEKYYDYDDWCNSVMPRDIPCTRTYEKQFFADRSPYRPGEIVYVKETWATDKEYDPYAPNQIDSGAAVLWIADGSKRLNGPEEWGRVRPSIFMPAWAARIHLEIVSVRPERLGELTADEAFNEGMNYRGSDGELHHLGDHPSYSLLEFQHLWNSLHPGSWDQNPWVFRIEFRAKKEG